MLQWPSSRGGAGAALGAPRSERNVLPAAPPPPQLIFSLGLTHGASGRGLSTDNLDKLVAECADYLRHLLAYFYAADGARDVQHNERLRIAQGRLCGHESLVRAQQAAPQRCSRPGYLAHGHFDIAVHCIPCCACLLFSIRHRPAWLRQGTASAAVILSFAPAE